MKAINRIDIALFKNFETNSYIQLFILYSYQYN